MCIDIPDELRDEDVAVGLVKKYFEDDPATGRARYSGSYFERLGGGGDRPEVAYQITAEDLLAVSMLSVPVVRYYALHVLDYRGREISGLLAQIPLDVHAERTMRLEASSPLEARPGSCGSLLRDIKPRPQDRKQLGPVAAGKLLARKRPHLIPVYDSHVKRALSRRRNDQRWWSDLRCQLTKDDALVRELETVRTRVGCGHLSLLRTFDIMSLDVRGEPGRSGKPDRQPSGHDCPHSSAQRPTVTSRLARNNRRSCAAARRTYADMFSRLTAASAFEASVRSGIIRTAPYARLAAR